MNDLNNLLRVLLENKVDFILIGGFAGVVHGSTQVTRDIDICVALNPKAIQTLRNALRDLHPRHRMNPSFKPSFLDEPKNLEGTKNLYLETDLGVLDVISEVIGIGSFDRLKAKAVDVEMLGYTCSVISIEDLIKCKTTLGRPKDLAVANELLALLDLRKN